MPLVVSALMQLPSAASDLLMFLASSSVLPLAPVLATFSDPAKSARLRRPVLVEPSGIRWCSVSTNRLPKNNQTTKVSACVVSCGVCRVV